MNPLTEQRVHLSGNPIKSQGETLLCLSLIIASLLCTAATALSLEVYWVGGAGGMGGGGQGGAKRRRRGRPPYAHSARMLHRITSVRLFCSFPSSSFPLSFFFLFLSLCVSLLPSIPPLPSQFPF